MQESNLADGRDDKSAEYGSTASITSKQQETRATIVSHQGQQPPSGQAQAAPGAETLHTSITPAQRPDGDGVRQIEELRRTFYELVNQKTSASEPKVDKQTSAAKTESPPQPPLQQVVVINRIAGSRSRSRAPYAFWERSGMARTTLKMIR